MYQLRLFDEETDVELRKPLPRVIVRQPNALYENEVHVDGSPISFLYQHSTDPLLLAAMNAGFYDDVLLFICSK